MRTHRVHLDQVFEGPMDLLLHLVRQQEVEIHEVEILRVVDGFLAYLSELEKLDLEYAGDFVVMAATLLAIKSRSLLPADEVDLDEDLDPGDELIERLLEYRRFRDVAEDLHARWEDRGRIASRGWRGEVKELEGERFLDLSELTPYDLLAAFSRLMRETARDTTHHVTSDPRPLRWYVSRVVEGIRSKPKMTLRELLDAYGGEQRRESLVGSFCAVLELCRVGAIRVAQDERGADIGIELVPEGLSGADELLREGFEDERDPSAEDAPEGGSNGAGA